MNVLKIICNICLLIVLFFSARAQGRFKVLDYNVLTGFQKNPAQAAIFVEWVKGIDPDMVAMQELSTFTQDSLERLARRYGHAYAVLLTKERAAPMGITSKYPIVNVQKVTDNMHHGYICARVKHYHVVVTHLSPFSYEKCKEEISNILAWSSTLPKKEKLMIMGDLNAFAATDSLLYQEKGYKRRYGVIRQLLEAGFTDAFAFKKQVKEFSYPTKKYENGVKQYGRLDYIFLNGALKKDCLDIRIVRDQVTDQLSDHYPLLMELSL
ncbi:exodeoxyribonuclease-3 [Pedobacter africanus]|uniref:Exodeoxyribonuclease-3 n=1 Tax=Pedobacter africanus TaxID=151894 RepID=A0ACC6L2Q2_9SPHI|nr:endonuclease/exonuclease/phosphatase family protein [Pedobacter africanus]MDR6785626.1 exodeoxyribonuclease-3 [Pedobacter africanus]